MEEFRIQTDRGPMLIAAASLTEAQQIARADGHTVAGDTCYVCGCNDPVGEMRSVSDVMVCEVCQAADTLWATLSSQHRVMARWLGQCTNIIRKDIQALREEFRAMTTGGM